MYGECCGCGEGRGHGRMGGEGRGEGYGPGRMAGWGYEGAPHLGGGHGGGFGWAYGGPTKAERKEWLEEFKKHLEERLSDVNEEIAAL